VTFTIDATPTGYYVKRDATAKVRIVWEPTQFASSDTTGISNLRPRSIRVSPTAKIPNGLFPPRKA
jgi:hypothetical protein